MKRIIEILTATSLLFGVLIAELAAQTNVLTYHNDLARTGANLNESVLNPSNVNSASFGKLFGHTVDGYVYAQPLFMGGVPIAGQGRHNVVFVATEGDSIYAFDADNSNGTNANPLWHISFTNGANITPVSEADAFNCVAINPQIGITGTPVIDPASMTLYAVTATKETSGNSVNFVNRFRAVDITTGLEKPGSGMAVSAPPGLAYNPSYMIQRTGLTLLSGKVYFGIASACDHRPYNGLLVSFDSATLQQIGAFAPSPGDAGGVWGGGDAPSVDLVGNIFAGIGNGNFDGVTSFGSALVKLDSQLHVVDYFSPYDVNTVLNPADLDLGSSMPIVLPSSTGSPAHPNLMVIGGKGGLLYLVDRDKLERWEPLNNTLLPSPPQPMQGGLFGRSAYFNGKVFVSTGYGSVESFAVSNAQLSFAGATTSTYGPWTGASLGISANGTSQGILWVLSGDPRSATTVAVLDAYDPNNLQTQLYTSQNGVDTPGGGNRWAVPTVAQGKVYVTATADAVSGAIATFGLKSVTCATDVSSQVTVTRGGWRYNRVTNLYGETLTLTNTGNTTVGPVSLVVDGLSPFAMLPSATGTTTCGSSTGSFYQNPAVANNMLSPGQSLPIFLLATSSLTQTIGFNTRVLAGAGVR